MRRRRGDRPRDRAGLDADPVKLPAALLPLEIEIEEDRRGAQRKIALDAEDVGLKQRGAAGIYRGDDQRVAQIDPELADR